MFNPRMFSMVANLLWLVFLGGSVLVNGSKGSGCERLRDDFVCGMLEHCVLVLCVCFLMVV